MPKDINKVLDELRELASDPSVQNIDEMLFIANDRQDPVKTKGRKVFTNCCGILEKMFELFFEFC